MSVNGRHAMRNYQALGAGGGTTPLLGFLIFQRTFLRGTGLGGALKG